MFLTGCCFVAFFFIPFTPYTLSLTHTHEVHRVRLLTYPRVLYSSSILSYTPPISSSGFSAFTTNGSTIGEEAEVDGRQAAAFGRRDTTPAGAGPIAAGSTTTVPGGGRSAGPLQALHYVLWLLLNGGMWNSGDRILCDMFGRWEMCGWWKFT